MSPAAAGRDNGQAVPGDGEGKAERAQRAGDRRRDVHAEAHRHTHAHSACAGLCRLIISLTAALGSGDLSPVRPADALPAFLHPIPSPAVKKQSCDLPLPVSPLFSDREFPPCKCDHAPGGKGCGRRDRDGTDAARTALPRAVLPRAAARYPAHVRHPTRYSAFVWLLPGPCPLSCPVPVPLPSTQPLPCPCSLLSPWPVPSSCLVPSPIACVCPAPVQCAVPTQPLPGIQPLPGPCLVPSSCSAPARPLPGSQPGPRSLSSPLPDSHPLAGPQPGPRPSPGSLLRA